MQVQRGDARGVIAIDLILKIKQQLGYLQNCRRMGYLEHYRIADGTSLEIDLIPRFIMPSLVPGFRRFCAMPA